MSNTCSVNLINAGVVVNGNSATAEFLAVGAATSFKCRLDKGRTDTCVSPLSYDGLSSGEHRLRIIPQGCPSSQGQTFRFNV